MSALAVERRTPPDHDRCDTHRRYKLNCAQYEELLTASSQRCQICRRSVGHQSRPKLDIDHEFWGDLWAVRGLLCTGCNTNLGQDGQGWPSHKKYLANTWWRAKCAENGVIAGLRPEPEIGTVIRNQWDTIWIHTAEGRWDAIRQGGVGRGAKPWKQLHRAYGPHNLLPMDITVEGVEYDEMYWARADIDRNPRHWARDDVYRVAAERKSAELAFAKGVLFQ